MITACSQKRSQAAVLVGMAIAASAIAFACLAAISFAPASAWAAQGTDLAVGSSAVAESQDEATSQNARNASDFLPLSAFSIDTSLTPMPKLAVRVNVKGKGWLKAVRANKVAGGKKRVLRAIRINMTKRSNITGNIKYRIYDKGKGWSDVATAGESIAKARRGVQGVQIWLTGQLSKEFEVRYRVYVHGKGWQPWVKDMKKTGIMKGKYYVTAVRMKLVRKTAVDETKKRLDGIDISSWQEGLVPKKMNADFIIVKATEGTWYTNPYFQKWARATLSCGKLLGAYHFAKTGSATAEADFFLDEVGGYVGRCVLFLDYEADAISNGPAWAKKFMDRVYKRTGVKPLIYMSKSVCNYQDWSACVKAGYKLWVAQYQRNGATRYLKKPWTDSTPFGAWDAPTIFQYTSSGRIRGYGGDLDLNLFYGNVKKWRALQSRS